MRKLLLSAVALLVAATLALAHTYPTTYYKTYSVSAIPYATDYMTFQPYHAVVQLDNLLRVREKGDFLVMVKYLSGLQAQELQVSSAAGRPYLSIPVATPSYQVTVYDKDRVQVLDKQYGGQKLMVDYGKGAYTDEAQLKNAWAEEKNTFLQKIEFQNLKFEQLQTELSELVQRLESIAPVVVEKSTSEPVTEVVDIFAEEEDTVAEEASTEAPAVERVFGANAVTPVYEEAETTSDMDMETKMDNTLEQEDPGLTTANRATYKNLVKLNLPNLSFKNITLNYERVLSDRNSATLTVGYLLPSAFTVTNSLSSTIVDEKFSGFTATGEYRIYRKKKGAPKGFYYAPYARYANYKFDFNETIEGYPSTVASRVSTYGLGIQIGTQWIIKDRFVIDWGFLGASIQQYNLKGTFTSSDPMVDFNEIRESLEMDIEDSNILNSPIEFTSGDDFLKAKLPFLFGGLRSYLTVGMQF